MLFLQLLLDDIVPERQFHALFSAEAAEMISYLVGHVAWVHVQLAATLSWRYEQLVALDDISPID